MREILKNINTPLLFDGAMGTVLQSSGLKLGEIPEELNISNPDVITSIHKKYIESGSSFVTTNTFGANSYKLKNSKYSQEEIIKAAISNAKSATEGSNAYVAYDIGPIGLMMKPIGTLTFDSAYEYFKEQVISAVKYGADLFIIETMADLNEARAAILAVKENSDLPVFATMTFSEDERTITGSTPEIMVAAFEALRVDVLGVNCSLGPNDLLPIVERITSASSVPVLVQANAGLPKSVMGKTEFSVKAQEYSDYAKKFVDAGVSIIGGCCGTDFDYIKEVSSAIKNMPLNRKSVQKKNLVCSGTTAVCLDNDIILIGERINPSGNKRLKEAFLNGDHTFATKIAFEQIEKGAKILDINTSLPQISEIEFMSNILDEFNGLIEAPLQIDSTKPEVIEMALRKYPGVAIINSVNGKKDSMEQIFPLAKKYGAYLVALCFDEEGIPETADKRIDIAEKLISTAKEYGINENMLLIDTLVLTASAQQEAVMETLKAIRSLKSKYDIKTTLGLSNVSYGLPFRSLINRTYFAMALSYGLDTVIIDPGAEGITDTLYAYRLLANLDKDAKEYISYMEKDTQVKETPKTAENLSEISIEKLILEGQKEKTFEKTVDLLKTNSPLEVVDNYLIPTLDVIGRYFEEKKIFLPQLIRSAETVGVAFEHIREILNQSKSEKINKGRIILATVKGDVHDIGKNLVKVLLENYGFEIIDLGKDVPTSAILEAIEKHDISLIGLSALMTTTVDSMEESIQAIRATYPNKKIFVGGAVLTPDYAISIGADHYCKDARASVQVAQEHFK